jgi:hypothetical protein
MKLSVRLGEREEKALRGLKRRRVNVSALVRRALVSANAESETESKKPSDIIRETLSKFPERPSGSVDRPPLSDRRAVQAYLQRQVRRRLHR